MIYRHQKSPKCEAPADTWEKKMKARIKDRWEASWIYTKWKIDHILFLVILFAISLIFVILFLFTSLIVSNFREPILEPRRSECAMLCKSIGASQFRLEGQFDLDVMHMQQYAGSHCQCACNDQGVIKIVPWKDESWEDIE